MSTCVPAHALLSALVSRLRAGGPDTSEKELRAVIGSGVPRTDVERALEEAGAPFERARHLLRNIP